MEHISRPRSGVIFEQPREISVLGKRKRNDPGIPPGFEIKFGSKKII